MAAAKYVQDGEMGEYGEEYPEEVPDPRYAMVTDEGRIESVHSEMAAEEPPTPDVTTVDKKEQKRLEKEQREREKREKEETKRRLKEQDKLIKEEAKKLKDVTPRKKEREEKTKEKGTPSAGGTPSSAKKRSPAVRPKNVVQCRVRLLDGTDYQFEIERGARGSLLLEMVCEHLNLLEREYFSCTYDEDGVRFWLLKDRRVLKQIRNMPWVFDFSVKFYPPVPNTLQEDITRYLMCLQIRGDILCGKLPCTSVTNALLGAYIAQSELGDYDPAEFGQGYDYLREFNFCPNQSDELLAKIAQLHPTLRDQTPAEAELNYLTNATKLELYGIELQSAKDAEMVNIFVGVSYAGLFVYRDNVRVNRFPWPVILKMSYKKRNFYVKIRPAEREVYITTIAFMMPSHKLAKRFWRLAIEHHSFFRLKIQMPVDRGIFARFGSSRHRFSGKTYFETHTWASKIGRPPPYFERLGSHQNTSRSLGSMPTRTKSSEDYEDRSRQYDADESQVAVVAGTAPAASRVAYVKTVQSSGGTTDMSASAAGYHPDTSATGYPDTSFKDTSYSGYRPKVEMAGGDVVVKAEVNNEQSFDDEEWTGSSANASFSRSVEASGATGPAVLPKKKKVPTATLR